MNYAIDNGKKFFMSYDNGVMSIIDIAQTGKQFESRAEWLVNGDLCHDSLRACIDSLHGYMKPIIYRGENINVWERDIFLHVNKYTGEVFEDYHFNDSILNKLEPIQA